MIRRRLHALIQRLRVWPLGPDPLAADRRLLARSREGDYEPWADAYLDKLAAEADEAMRRLEDPEC